MIFLRFGGDLEEEEGGEIGLAIEMELEEQRECELRTF